MASAPEIGATFVFAPGVRIYIKTDGHGTLDVSDDLVDYTIQRRSDGPSTLNFSLQNIQRKYDQVFSPNDEVVVELKRVTWVRVFTGLLNSVPLITMWPRVVAFSASCSLKRLQYWTWDPQLASSYMTAVQALGAGAHTADGGISNVILTLLNEVVGWPERKVHIGVIPDAWFLLIEPYIKTLVGQLKDADASVLQALNQIGMGTVSGAAVDGTTTGTGAAAYTAPTGVFSASIGEYSPARLRNAEIIIRLGKSISGCTDKDIVTAVGTAMSESRLDELYGIDPSHRYGHESGKYQGLFNQDSGWGGLPPGDRTDPVKTAQVFYNRLLGKSASARNWQNAEQFYEIVWQVQGFNKGSDTHSNVTSCFGPAQEVLQQFNRVVGGALSYNNAGATANDAASQAAAQSVAKQRGTLPRSAAEAIAYMQQMDANNAPLVDVGLCDHYVAAAFGLAHSNSKSAAAHWEQVPADLKHPGDRNPPPGALVFWLNGWGHVALSLGGGKVAGTDWPTPLQIGVGTIDEITNGWHHPYAGWSVPWFNGQGQAPVAAAGSVSSSGSGAGSATGVSTALSPYSAAQEYDPDNPIDKLFGEVMFPEGNQQQTLEQTMALAFSGPRALLNDQPLLPYIKNLVNSSMRSFCSAPNGDFMAWFPDYYGLWGTAATMVLEPIEVQDFYVEWTDDYFVTHQYTVAGFVNYLDGFSGQMTTTFTPPDEGLATPFSDDRLTTAGVASIDIPSVMYALFGINLTTAQADAFRKHIYQKFGARPDFKEMDGMVGKAAEIFSAMYYFMRQWAYQYNANVPTSFMPELWPGMLIQIPAYDFQAYVTAVTHSGQMGEGGGHTTSINIAAPARMPKKGSREHVLLWLPVAGGIQEVHASVLERIDPGITQAENNARRAGSG